jgi:hypothetical protein
LPFKCNLQRYIAVMNLRGNPIGEEGGMALAVGRCKRKPTALENKMPGFNL